MRLVLREYLQLMKESREFDALLPDLLLEMGFLVISKPQIGVRQHGVDLAAVGNDEDGKKKLFLLVVKQGDIGRTDWNTGPQSVKQSLDEVRYSYLHSHVPPKYKELPVVIVVCTTGDVKQDVAQEWTGYQKEHTEPGKREYELWNGDWVAERAERYLLNENLLPENARSYFRKTLAFVGEAGGDATHFYQLIDTLLFADLGVRKKSLSAKRKYVIKQLRTVNIALSILFRWAESEGNLLVAFVSAERSVLSAWEAIRRMDGKASKPVYESYGRILLTFRDIYSAYFRKVQQHCYIKNAFSIYSSDSSLVAEKVWEQIGIIGLIAVAEHLIFSADDGGENSKVVAEALAAAIVNNGVSGSPPYDGNSIETNISLIALSVGGQNNAALAWLRTLVRRVIFAYGLNRHFPVATDDFNDLIDLSKGSRRETVGHLRSMSTFIPTLAMWCALLNMEGEYQALWKAQEENFKGVCLQLWYPDDETEGVLYCKPAQYETGVTQAPLLLPSSADEMRGHIRAVFESERVPSISTFSSEKEGVPLLDMIASRHFRTPLSPEYFYRLLLTRDKLESLTVPADDGGDEASY